ncbi:hypothetical protein KP509_01G115300 [Ceratopteris richardii]|uniref:Uncharacterized protein n=1 Tax=Ceratopteris richardii TaxID=49495 RepID=A0A8T2VNC7_CERRI|nr:hypothetical protein KP509_01G115300 [Ceratopteris richardii]
MAPSARTCYLSAGVKANGGYPRRAPPSVEVTSMGSNTWRVKVTCEKGPRTLDRLVARIEQAGLLLLHVDISVHEPLLNLNSVASLQTEDEHSMTLDPSSLRESLLQIINEELHS